MEKVDFDKFREGFETFMNEIHTNATKKGWWDEEKLRAAFPETISAKLALVHSEISEALEELRKCETQENLASWVCYFENGSTKPEGFGVELADVMIRCMDLAKKLEIDLPGLMIAKHRYNET